MLISANCVLRFSIQWGKIVSLNGKMAEYTIFSKLLNAMQQRIWEKCECEERHLNFVFNSILKSVLATFSLLRSENIVSSIHISGLQNKRLVSEKCTYYSFCLFV